MMLKSAKRGLSVELEDWRRFLDFAARHLGKARPSARCHVLRRTCETTAPSWSLAHAAAGRA
jgi:hypothetical protein